MTFGGLRRGHSIGNIYSRCSICFEIVEGSHGVPKHLTGEQSYCKTMSGVIE